MNGVPLLGEHRTFCRFAPALTLYATDHATSLIALNATALEEYEQKLHLYRDFLQQSEKTDELLAYVTEKYPTDEKLLALVEKLEILEEK